MPQPTIERVQGMCGTEKGKKQLLAIWRALWKARGGAEGERRRRVRQITPPSLHNLGVHIAPLPHSSGGTEYPLVGQPGGGGGDTTAAIHKFTSSKNPPHVNEGGRKRSRRRHKKNRHRRTKRRRKKYTRRRYRKRKYRKRSRSRPSSLKTKTAP